MVNTRNIHWVAYICILSLFLFGGVALTPVAAAETADTSGPVVQNYTISNDSFEAGETMKIDVNVTDETDIQRIYFRFENTEGGGAVFDAYQDFQPPVDNGTYTISYEWPDDTPAGTYSLSYVSASDGIGNRRTYFEDFPGKERINITKTNRSITTTASETVGSEAPGFGHLSAITALISATLLVIWTRI